MRTVLHRCRRGYSALAQGEPDLTTNADPVGALLLHFRSSPAADRHVSHLFSTGQHDAMLSFCGQWRAIGLPALGEASLRREAHVSCKRNDLARVAMLYRWSPAVCSASDSIQSEVVKYLVSVSADARLESHCLRNGLLSSRFPQCQSAFFSRQLRAQSLERALQHAESLLEKGDRLTQESLSFLSSLCHASRRFEEVISLVRKHSEGVELSPTVFCLLVCAYQNLQHYGNVIGEISSAVRRTPALLSPALLYSLYLCHQQLDASHHSQILLLASQCLSEVFRRGEPFLMDDLACGSVLFFLGQLKEYPRLLTILNRVLFQLNEDRSFTYAQLWNVAYGQGTLLSLLRMMQSQGIGLRLPFRVYRPLLELLAHQDERSLLQEVFNVLETSDKPPFPFDRHYYSLKLPSLTPEEVEMVWNRIHRRSLSSAPFDLLFLLAWRLEPQYEARAHECLVQSLRKPWSPFFRVESAPVESLTALLSRRRDYLRLAQFYEHFCRSLGRSLTEDRRDVLRSLRVFERVLRPLAASSPQAVADVSRRIRLYSQRIDEVIPSVETGFL